MNLVKRAKDSLAFRMVCTAMTLICPLCVIHILTDAHIWERRLFVVVSRRHIKIILSKKLK